MTAHVSRRESSPPVSRRYYPLRIAAERMHTTAHALRVRCQRAPKRAGGQVDLGGGFIAVKFGNKWLVSMPVL
jgi:hypothetical protein